MPFFSKYHVVMPNSCHLMPFFGNFMPPHASFFKKIMLSCENSCEFVSCQIHASCCSCHAISCHLFFHAVSCHAISCHIFFHVVSCFHFMPFHATFFFMRLHVMPFHATYFSCGFMSCHFMSLFSYFSLHATSCENSCELM